MPRTLSAVRSPDPSRLREVIARAETGADVTAEEWTALLDARSSTAELFRAAAARRDAAWGRTVTYSPKVFLPVTNLCRDRCTYCTFRKDPHDPDAWTMRPEEIDTWARRGRALGCTEALLCLGDRPEAAYPAYRETLRGLGHRTTAEYVHRAARIALAVGLLPHTNAGVLTSEEMAALRPVNVSLGLMLENVSPRLRMRGGVHQWAPDKAPQRRLRMLHEAGALRIPFTTGLLLGIGETSAERIDTLLAIREAHRRFGHVQEVIVQPYRAKPTVGYRGAEPSVADVARTVAVARLLLDPEVAVQAPPNLVPSGQRLLLAAGLNDWGGISPLTPDYVNPEAPWPHVQALAETCRRAGYRLVPRLPVYERYLREAGWVDPGLLPAIGRALPGAAALPEHPAA